MTAPSKTNFTPPGLLHFVFDGSILVEVGDLLFHDSNDVKPASSQTDQGSAAANKALFAPLFAGVANDARLAASTDAVTSFSVLTDVVMEVDCVSATFEVGDMVSATENAGGTALEDQKVEKTTDPQLAIGTVYRRYGTATTRVVVRFQSNVVKESFQVAASFPVASQQALAAGGGAVTLTEYYTSGASDAGGDAWTLADGLFLNQMKKIQLTTDGGGDATLTPTTLNGGTTITFADVGDYAVLVWDGAGWTAVELGNDADGTTAPVLA